MVQYLNTEVVKKSFRAFCPRTRNGKTGQERTSALMYFLAFDATVHKGHSTPVDLNPECDDGMLHRELLKIEYAKLVQLEKQGKTKRTIATLGIVEENGISPNKRITSNFYTTPLKKASASSEAYIYPKRPKPLLRMGKKSTGLKWGIDYHCEWKNNLPHFFTEFTSSTPFTDLAIVMSRRTKIDESTTGLYGALDCYFKINHTNQLTDLWTSIVKKEKRLFSAPTEPFSMNYSEQLESSFTNRDLHSWNKHNLVNRIKHLESVLRTNNIDFEYDK